ncbi:m-phase inducer phosphatase [Rhizina undulata]
MEMDAPSPLTALQPLTTPWQLARGELSKGDSLFGPKLKGGALAMGKASSYFELETRLDTSPTSTLAADLSQNFHIDKTPQVPTPRRSLFPQLLNKHKSTSTPKILSSPVRDVVDMSPLPHKMPRARLNERKLRSPTSSSSSTIPGLDLCSSLPTAASDSPRKDATRRPSLVERKRSSFTRPSLLRPQRSTLSFKSTTSPPSLPFGKGSAASQMKLEDLFAASPPQNEKKIVAPSPTALGSPPRSKLFNISPGSTSLDGSPIAPLNRARFQRPKGRIRRTLSMFDNPKEVMKKDLKEANKIIASPLDKASVEESSILPSHTIKDDSLRRIDKSVLCQVMDGKFKENYDELVIVDCRFEYEYDGGHVAGAINVNSTEALEKMFFDEPKAGKVLIIFHCEYSAHRAPRMALHLRSRDRQLNLHRYPGLYYPEVYILEGGYSSFFNAHRTRCEPQEYVEMNDKSHRITCEREMGRFRRNTRIGRTQSFTFGAHLDDVESSPSSNFSRRPSGACAREGGDSLGTLTRRQRHDSRRMASY